MAQSTRMLRRGLPRTPGGAPWPPEGDRPADLSFGSNKSDAPSSHAEVAVEPKLDRTPGNATGKALATVSRPLRRGLPRVNGGEPWPPAGEVKVLQTSPGTVSQSSGATGSPGTAAQQPTDISLNGTKPRGQQSGQTGDVALRRGLPRRPGGEPWPPPGFAPSFIESKDASNSSINTVSVERSESPAVLRQRPAGDASSTKMSSQENPKGPDQVSTSRNPEKSLSHVRGTSTPAETPVTRPAETVREPIMIGSKSLSNWVKSGLGWGGGLILLAALLVLAARGVTTLPGVPDFLERYPGEYPLPEFVEPGFPAWVRWSHFLNFFLLVLIIRTGLQVRHQQKPPAFFTSKRGGKKISINLWLHTSLDILWVLNGVIFVVLLFASGHWARIVPTSWEVFPNAASALLQYMTLDWPLEDGWVSYNALQQIMYFTVVFIAAPLAALTGVRMSEWWPKNAKTLNKVYPAPLARALHYPTMLFFVVFVLTHVFLVFATGALKNLNHMYAGTPVVNWTGFWWFVASLAVVVGAVFAARPLVLAPLANLFGKVSNR